MSKEVLKQLNIQGTNFKDRFKGTNCSLRTFSTVPIFLRRQAWGSDSDMDNDRVDQIIDKHQGEASSLIQVLLDIQSENHWLPQGSIGEGQREIAGSFNPDTAHCYLL